MVHKDSKILVTGVRGQLGFDCVRELKERGYSQVLGVDKEELERLVSPAEPSNL